MDNNVNEKQEKENTTNSGHVDFGKNSLARKLGEIDYLDIFRRIWNTFSYILCIIFNLSAYEKNKGEMYIDTEEFFMVGPDSVYKTGRWIFPSYPENSILTIIILLVVIFIF